MNVISSCRCCLSQPPDKDLKTAYTSNNGKSEVYGDILKECFEINLPLDTSDANGICNGCVERLRDAADFKHQVLKCQKEFQDLAEKIKAEKMPPLKEEYLDMDDHDDNDLYFFELKEEITDIEEIKEDEKLAEILGLNEVTVKKKHKKKKGKKKDLEDSDANSQININSNLSLSFQGLKKIKLDLTFLSENKKHVLNVENIIKYSNCTPFSNKTLQGIVCAYCKETYPTLQELRIHTEGHKKKELSDCKRMDTNNLSIKVDTTDLKCTICNADVNSLSNLETHLTKEHNIKFHEVESNYILEFKLKDGDILNCALCNSTFETFKMLLQHMNRHYRNYICDECDMGFINKHRLKSHKRTHDVGIFKCAFCDKVFNTRVRKNCHEKYTHNTSARYTTNCPQCDQSFTSYYQRNRHMFKEHNTAAATYKCNICDKSFILKSKLTSHIKKVHLMERNHTCSECGQGFFIKQSLDEHMIKHNGERVFKCTVCHKAYARKKTLREHMRIHNNDRRFKCEICGLTFVQKCSMKSHMLSNHGVTLMEFLTNRSKVSP